MGLNNLVSLKTEVKTPKMGLPMQKIPILYLPFLNSALQLIVNAIFKSLDWQYALVQCHCF